MMDPISFCSEKVDFNSLSVTDILTELPEKAEEEMNKVGTKRRAPITDTDPNQALAKEIRYRTFSYRPSYKGSSKQEIIEQARQGIVYDWNLMDMPKAASAILSNVTMTSQIKKVCADRTLSRPARREQIKAAL